MFCNNSNLTPTMSNSVISNATGKIRVSSQIIEIAMLLL